MPEQRTLIATGRDADVFDQGDGTVLRRYRGRDVPASEVEVMRFAREQGYPAPRVISCHGRDLVLERIGGPTMQDVLAREPARLAEMAAELAHLHDRLHAIAAPAWLREVGTGDRLLHLDLHPGNVLLSPDGPVVIDWANAARGPAALDPALAIVIFVTARANVDAPTRAGIDAFTREFASRCDSAAIEAVMPLAIGLRTRDANISDRERAELAAWRTS